MRPLDLIPIASIREMVLAIDPDDESFLADTIEGETDAGELLDVLLLMDSIDKAHIVANKERIRELTARNARFEQRAKAIRVGMHKLLDATGLCKMERAAATVSIRAVPPKVLGYDMDVLRTPLLKIIHAPDRTKIKDALLKGDLIPGWSMDNGGSTVSIRRR